MFNFNKAVIALVSVLTLAMPLARPPAPQMSVFSQQGIYLALGDSITFGYNPLLDPRNANNFVGYPTAVARTGGLSLSNLACPGASSSYAVSVSGQDWDCISYRLKYPLHVSYSGSQLDYTVSVLRASYTGANVRLVTVMLGFDDLYRVGALCSWQASCVQASLPTALVTLRSNLLRIVYTLRALRYTGQLTLMTYYAVNTDPVMTGYIEQVNSVITQSALTFSGVRVADGFGAFQRAAAPYGANPCAAGLLIRLDAQTCDIHPSPLGQAVLGRAMQSSLGALPTLSVQLVLPEAAR